MRFSVEAWATEYGAPLEGDELEPTAGEIDPFVERDANAWEPIDPPVGEVPGKVLFTDGVRRIEARVWIEDATGRLRPGVCASYAAGVMCCDGRATLLEARVERGLFSAVMDAEAISCRHATYEVRRATGESPQDLWLAIQERMGMLEAELARGHDPDLVIVDGPLRGLHGLTNVVGYVKTHHVGYLPEPLDSVVGELKPGQRTPIFLTLGRFSRFSWYLRLPGAEGHTWAGIVRCESTADSDIADVIVRADQVTALLPRFASEGYKDPRAPQNLYPIAGLERALRRRLGDPGLMYRSLRSAAACVADAAS
ncbi:MAG TPA: DNA double-strand break repair nuclease NurA [Actinomycetota bacterium]|nr:DNA double-strand break repair nuclease NurA [Actinomycetota bacterium]